MWKWTFQAFFWWSAVWLLRLSLIIAGIGCWAFLQQSEWLWSGGSAAAAFFLFSLQRVARRQALGWIIDDNGERQKVTSWSRGHAIFTPTTRSHRIVQEAQLRDERRKSLLWSGVLGWGLAGFAWYAWPQIRSSDLMAMLFGLACLFGGTALLGWFMHLLTELLYQSGWQDMAGAKVLDHPPSRPGLEEVEQQKTHGDARVASEAEALALLNAAA
jgi:hypothetical protein